MNDFIRFVHFHEAGVFHMKWNVCYPSQILQGKNNDLLFKEKVHSEEFT